MTTETAVKPKLSLADLIDQRLALDETIKALSEQKESLKQDITAEMKAKNCTKAFGTKGVGYQLTESIKAEYPAKAVQYTIKQRIDHLFRSEPSITRSKVMNFLKKKLITEAQFRYLQRVAGKDYTETTLKTIKEAAGDVQTV